MVTRKQILDMAARVADIFKPERILLFGSYAYGKPSLNSDVDLLVVMPHDGLAARKAAEVRLALPDDISVDVLVRTPQALKKRVDLNDSFIKEILSKGVTLYETGSA